MRLRHALVGTALAATLLVGCSDDPPEAGNLDDNDEPGQSEPNTPNTDEEPDNGGDDTIITDGDGDDVDPETETEIETFVQSYFDASNEAIEDGDFSDVDAMVSSCSVCERSRDYIASVYDDGGRIEGAQFTEPDILVGAAHDDRISVTAQVTTTEYEEFDQSGASADDGPAEERNYQFEVSEIDGRWQIVSGSTSE